MLYATTNGQKIVQFGKTEKKLLTRLGAMAYILIMKALSASGGAYGARQNHERSRSVQRNAESPVLLIYTLLYPRQSDHSQSMTRSERKRNL